MKVQSITASNNSLLKTIRSLHERKGREKSGLFLIEGSRALREALQKELDVENIVVSRSYFERHQTVIADYSLESISVVEDKIFNEVAGTVTPEGILAVTRMPAPQPMKVFEPASAALIVVAHAVQDPGNLGTLMRSALAASVTGMILTKGTVDPFNPKVVRGAMGAIFALPLVWDIDFKEAMSRLKAQRIQLIACEAEASNYYFDTDLCKPTAIILGNEGNGLTGEEQAAADQLVSIPMNTQSESLNVAVSGSIVLFSAVEQRARARGR